MTLRSATLAGPLLLGIFVGCGRDERSPGGAPAPSAPGASAAPPVSATGAAPVSAPAPVDVTPIVVREVGFAGPSSVEYDAKADVYLVANVNGKPGDADDNGFISRVSPDGKVLDLKWIDGATPGVTLDAPRGLTLTGTELFVTDRKTVRVFDRRTGKPGEVFEIPEASGLDDVAPGPNGSVYVTDPGADAAARPTGTDAIYYGHESLGPLIRDPTLGGPRGIVHDLDGALCVTFGGGELVRVDGKGKRLSAVKLPKGKLDGLARLDDGKTLLVSSWEAGAIYRGPATGPFQIVLEGIGSPADIAYDHKRRRVLIAQIDEGALQIRPLP